MKGLWSKARRFPQLQQQLSLQENPAHLKPTKNSDSKPKTKLFPWDLHGCFREEKEENKEQTRKRVNLPLYRTTKEHPNKEK